MSHFVEKHSDCLTESKAHCEKLMETTEPKKKKKKQTNNPQHESQAFKHNTPNVFPRNSLQGVSAQVPPCPCVAERLPHSETVANCNTPKRLTANKKFFM
jgi:hypothetical protein